MLKESPTDKRKRLEFEAETARLVASLPKPPVLFSPGNQLTYLIKKYSAEIHTGTPIWAHFPRWYRTGTALWLESSSGSRLLTVDFDEGEIVVPDWKVRRDAVDKYTKIPELWKTLHLGSLFDPRTGDALHPDEYAYGASLTDWKGNL